MHPDPLIADPRSMLAATSVADCSPRTVDEGSYRRPDVATGEDHDGGDGPDLHREKGVAR
jgi:hypothetical protein